VGGAKPADIKTLDARMIYCGFCGKSIAAEDVFCAHCSARQPIASMLADARAARATARLIVVR
jgi:hypothetical protein